MTANASRTDEATDQHAVRVATDKFDRLLDDWHGRIDELKVQVDLATLDVREDMAKRLEVTENVYLAVRSRLSDARHDAGQSVATVRQSVEELLVDLRRAYDDAEAVVTRGRET
jgi:hypothetical protein